MKIRNMAERFRKRRVFIDKVICKGGKPSPFIFRNTKTFGVSIDVSHCLLDCKRCYAKTLFCTRPNLRACFDQMHKTRVTPKQEQLFDSGLRAIYRSPLGFRHLRFFSWGDFHPKAIPLIHIASDVGFRVSIISKSLHLPKYRKHIAEIVKIPNVFVGLSFNYMFPETYVEEVVAPFVDMPNVKLHWTIMAEHISKQEQQYKEFKKTSEIKWDILHTTAYGKDIVAGVFGKNHTCCLSHICDDCRLCYHNKRRAA